MPRSHEEGGGDWLWWGLIGVGALYLYNLYSQQSSGANPSQYAIPYENTNPDIAFSSTPTLAPGTNSSPQPYQSVSATPQQAQPFQIVIPPGTVATVPVVQSGAKDNSYVTTNVSSQTGTPLFTIATGVVIPK